MAKLFKKYINFQHNYVFKTDVLIIHEKEKNENEFKLNRLRKAFFFMKSKKFHSLFVAKI